MPHLTASGKLLRETVESGGSTKILDFRYDQTGAPYSLTYTVGSTTSQSIQTGFVLLAQKSCVQYLIGHSLMNRGSDVSMVMIRETADYE